jgi:hypothetical protein
MVGIVHYVFLSEDPVVPSDEGNHVEIHFFDLNGRPQVKLQFDKRTVNDSTNHKNTT